VSPVYFDSIIAVCQGAGFSPRILHEVRSVVTQVAFVGCGQGIALVPAGLKRVAPDGVMFKPLTRAVDVVTTAAAWAATATNPALALAVEALQQRTKEA
jgi:DNA-binding transcriptional LysR family regulator